jgi:hypothetical protein
MVGGRSLARVLAIEREIESRKIGNDQNGRIWKAVRNVIARQCKGFPAKRCEA